MKRMDESHQRVRSAIGNGKKLSKRILDSALEELIKTFTDANKKLDDLLAKTKE